VATCCAYDVEAGVFVVTEVREGVRPDDEEVDTISGRAS
jgi:hypothetical protein